MSYFRYAGAGGILRDRRGPSVAKGAEFQLTEKPEHMINCGVGKSGWHRKTGTGPSKPRHSATRAHMAYSVGPLGPKQRADSCGPGKNESFKK